MAHIQNTTFQRRLLETYGHKLVGGPVEQTLIRLAAERDFLSRVADILKLARSVSVLVEWAEGSVSGFCPETAEQAPFLQMVVRKAFGQSLSEAESLYLLGYRGEEAQLIQLVLGALPKPTLAQSLLLKAMKIAYDMEILLNAEEVQDHTHTHTHHDKSKRSDESL